MRTFILSIAVSMVCNCESNAEPLSIDQFKRDARSQWQKREVESRNLSIEFTRVEPYGPSKKPILIQGRALFSEDATMIYEKMPKQFRIPGGDVIEKVYCNNPKYAFFLSRIVGSEQYLASHIGENNSQIKAKLSYGDNLRLAPITMLGTPLAEWLDRPGFAIASVERNDSSDTISIQSSYTPKDQDANRHFTSLTFAIDPAKKWSLVSFQAVTPRVTIQQTMEYTNENGELRPSKEVITYINADKKTPTTVGTMTFDVWKPGVVFEEQFRISHYGLPEPPGVEWKSKGWPFYVWALIATGVFGALYLVFRTRRRRAVA